MRIDADLTQIKAKFVKCLDERAVAVALLGELKDDHQDARRTDL